MRGMTSFDRRNVSDLCMANQFLFGLFSKLGNLFSPFRVFAGRCVNKSRRPEVSASEVIPVSSLVAAKFRKSSFLVARNVEK